MDQGKSHLSRFHILMGDGAHADDLKRIIKEMRMDLHAQGIQLCLLLTNGGDIALLYVGAQGVGHMIESAGEIAHLIIAIHRDMHIEIAGLHLVHLVQNSAHGHGHMP